MHKRVIKQIDIMYKPRQSDININYRATKGDGHFARSYSTKGRLRFLDQDDFNERMQPGNEDDSAEPICMKISVE